MFNIGDKVVYPSQGVGTIENIEQKDFLGNKQDYYYITLTNNLKVMLPTKKHYFRTRIKSKTYKP
ncbi:hypothetical protein M4I33_11645 [Clostridium sp. LY3-2]|uniref:CarD family transcriptional regulator n=1 Tax=Clostridium sp. LY3-2 TaxID=2942482 RepID=UPI002152CAE9|nr:CarD family transcriptional regulator [Clostridium sp. LY3-2]MCR6515522.1 hypothetical protein [Clostridium sp. LY3-2]